MEPSSKTPRDLQITFEDSDENESISLLEFPQLEVFQFEGPSPFPCWMEVPQTLKLYTAYIPYRSPAISSLWLFGMIGWEELSNRCPCLQMLKLNHPSPVDKEGLVESSDFDRDLHAHNFQFGPDVRYPHSETTDPNFEPCPRDLRSSRFNSTLVTSKSKKNLPPRPLPTLPSTNLQHETILKLGNPEIKKPISQFAMDRDSILGSRNRRSSSSSGGSSNPFNRLSQGSRKPLRRCHSFSPLRLKNRDLSLRFRTLSAVAEARESVSPQISPREAVMERGGMEVQLTRNLDSARDHTLTGSAFLKVLFWLLECAGSQLG